MNHKEIRDSLLRIRADLDGVDHQSHINPDRSRMYLLAAAGEVDRMLASMSTTSGNDTQNTLVKSIEEKQDNHAELPAHSDHDC